jgi:hypothetical protein
MDAGRGIYQDLPESLIREMVFQKFQKFDNYFMAVKPVPLELGGFRLEHFNIFCSALCRREDKAGKEEYVAILIYGESF